MDILLSLLKSIYVCDFNLTAAVMQLGLGGKHTHVCVTQNQYCFRISLYIYPLQREPSAPSTRSMCRAAPQREDPQWQVIKTDTINSSFHCHLAEEHWIYGANVCSTVGDELSTHGVMEVILEGFQSIHTQWFPYVVIDGWWSEDKGSGFPFSFNLIRTTKPIYKISNNVANNNF